MEKIEYQSHYWTVGYDDAHKAVVCRVISPDFLDDGFFKDEMRAYAEVVVRHKAPNLLLHLEKGSYAMSPEIQAWIEAEIAPQTIGAGQKKIAVVVSHDIFAAVSTEQLLEEGIIQTVTTRYFQDEESATQWLYS